MANVSDRRDYNSCGNSSGELLRTQGIRLVLDSGKVTKWVKVRDLVNLRA